jgi:hypothetical protein
MSSQVLDGIHASLFSQHDFLVGSINGQLNVVDRTALHLTKGIDDSLVDGEGNTVNISTSSNVHCAVSLFAKLSIPVSLLLSHVLLNALLIVSCNYLFLGQLFLLSERSISVLRFNVLVITVLREVFLLCEYY